MEAGGAEVQGHPWQAPLHTEFKASLIYLRLYFKTKNLEPRDNPDSPKNRKIFNKMLFAQLLMEHLNQIRNLGQFWFFFSGRFGETSTYYFYIEINMIQYGIGDKFT